MSRVMWSPVPQITTYACAAAGTNHKTAALCELVVQIERRFGSFTVGFYLGSSVLLCGGKFKGNVSGFQRIQCGMHIKL